VVFTLGDYAGPDELNHFYLKKSNTQKYRNHQRAFVGFLEEEHFNGIGEIVFDVVKVNRVHAGG